MNKSLFRNPGLKILSLVLGFVAWIAIINISNPVIPTRLNNIPVNVSNASYIESMNLSYRIREGFENVSVTVRGNRSVVDRLTTASVNANVDLTQIADLNSNPVMAPVTVTVPGISQENITVTPRNIQIVLEEMASTDFVLNPVTNGSTPSRGHEVGNMSCYPDRITLRGPESLLEKIDNVQAEVNVSNLDEDSALIPKLHVFDKNGDELSEKSMSYLTFSVSESEIRVEVELYKVITDVPIEAETYGKPREGYRVGEITVTPSTISLAGTDSAIDKVKSEGSRILIDEASHAVDISGANEDVDISVNLPDYLPAGMRVTEGVNETVVVSVKILEQNTTSIEIPVRDIEKQNLPTSLSAVFADSSIDVRVQGNDEVLSQLSPDQITAAVDFNNVKTGAQTLPVDITLPEGCTLVSDVAIDVTVTRTGGSENAGSEES